MDPRIKEEEFKAVCEYKAPLHEDLKNDKGLETKRKRDMTSRKKHSNSLNITLNSSRISQPKDPDKGK
jgi:hypothetical protein